MFVLGGLQLIVGAVNFYLAYLVWFKIVKRNVPSFYLGLTSIFSGIFAFTFGLSFLTGNSFYTKATWFGFLALPAIAHFLIVYFNRRIPNSKLLFFILWIPAVTFCLLAYTPLIIKEVISIYPNKVLMGPLEALARIYFSFIVLGILYLLLREYILSAGIQRLRIQYMLLGVAIYSSVAAVFSIILPLFHIQALIPFTTFFSSAWVGLTIYAILKHQLMDIRLAITKAGIFFVVYFFVLLFPIWLGYKLLGWGMWIMPVGVALLVATIGPVIHRKLQLKAEAVLLAQQKKYQSFLLRAGKGMLREHDLDHLLKSIVRVIRYGVKVQFAAAFLFDKKFERYELKALRDHHHMPDKFSVPQNHKLIELLQQKRAPLGHEDVVDIFEQYSGSPIHLIVPAFSDETLLGFIVLGEKEDHTPYTEDDIRVFSILAGQATMAIENCIFAKEAEEMQKDLAEKERLASMGSLAYHLSHQMGNHLQAFEQFLIEFELNLEVVLEKYPEPNAEREQAIIAFHNETFEKLRARFKHCATLTGSTCKLARDLGSELVFETFSFRQCVEGALLSVDVKHSLNAEARPFEIILDIPTGAVVHGVKVWLYESIFNVLDNCYEATVEKRDLRLSPQERATYKPFIKISFAETKDNNLITISDNGVGVKPEDRARMFEPWFTTKSSNISGKGIGMNGVYNTVVNLHGGKIRFESEYMKGITFFIELPKKSQDKPADAQNS